MIKYPGLFLVLFSVAACSTVPPPPCPPPTSGDIVYVTGEDWHTGISIPVNELGPQLSFYRQVFPGARVIMFGYGKKTFFTAPANTFSEYILGPVPGPAVIEAVGLYVPPTEAYPPENTITLTLPSGGSKALSDFIWNDLVKDEAGKPELVGPSHDPDGLFYMAKSEYNLFHTCNTWAAEALQATRLSVSGDDVVFSDQIMDQTARVAGNQCQP